MLKKFVKQVPILGELESLKKRDEIISLALQVLRRDQTRVIEGLLFISKDDFYIVVDPRNKNIGTTKSRTKDAVDWAINPQLYDYAINVLKNMLVV